MYLRYASAEETDVIRNVIPFGLCNGIGKIPPIVRVVDVLDCTNLPSNIKTDKFVHNPEIGSVSSTLKSWLQGERLKGTQFIETMLTEDTPLTAIGELRFDRGSSEMKLGSPRNGLPIYLTTGSVPSLLKEISKSAFILKVVVALTGAIGIFLLFRNGVKYYRMLKKKLQTDSDKKIMNELLAARRKANRTYDDVS